MPLEYLLTMAMPLEYLLTMAYSTWCILLIEGADVLLPIHPTEGRYHFSSRTKQHLSQLIFLFAKLSFQFVSPSVDCLFQKSSASHFNFHLKPIN